MTQTPRLPTGLHRQELVDVDGHAYSRYFLRLSDHPATAPLTYDEIVTTPALFVGLDFLRLLDEIRIVGEDFDAAFSVVALNHVPHMLDISLGFEGVDRLASAKGALRKMHRIAEAASEAGPAWIAPATTAGDNVSRLSFKKIKADSMRRNVAGHRTTQWLARLDADVTPAEVFHHSYWVDVAGQLAQHDKIRLRGGTFDFEATVVSISNDGPILRPWPIYPLDDEAEATTPRKRSPQVVPFAMDGKPKARIEHLAACGWRVRGADGQEISRDHKDAATAERALDEYLAAMGLELPRADTVMPESGTTSAELGAQAQAAKRARSVKGKIVAKRQASIQAKAKGDVAAVKKQERLYHD